MNARITIHHEQPVTLAERIIEALESVPAPPCEDCIFRNKCATERLACAEFAYYSGAMTPKKWRESYADYPRTPGRVMYNAAFPGDARTNPIGTKGRRAKAATRGRPRKCESGSTS